MVVCACVYVCACTLDVCRQHETELISNSLTHLLTPSPSLLLPLCGCARARASFSFCRTGTNTSTRCVYMCARAIVRGRYRRVVGFVVSVLMPVPLPYGSVYILDAILRVCVRSCAGSACLRVGCLQLRSPAVDMCGRGASALFQRVPTAARRTPLPLLQVCAGLCKVLARKNVAQG